MDKRHDSQPADSVLRGDRAAASLGRLLEQHQGRLYNVALRMVGNRDDAAEVTQEAMLKIIEHVGDFKGHSNIGTWMMRIVMNLSVSHLRKRRLRQTVSLDAGPGDSWADPKGAREASTFGQELPDPREPGPPQRVQHREMVGFLFTALAALDEDFRAVVVLRDIDELDYKEIAEVLSIPVGTVKSRLFRARLALRQKMFQICPGHEDASGSPPDSAIVSDTNADERPRPERPGGGA